MSPTSLAVIAFSFALSVQCEALEEQADLQQRRDLADAVVRFMAANDEIGPGDLIVRSQVSDLQQYLRKTRGQTPFASPRVLKRISPDKGQLSKIYHQQGKPILREAANSLGSYAPLDRLARSPNGRQRLLAAIESESVEALLDEIQAQQPAAQTAQRSIRMIYTVEELIRIYLEVETSPRTNLPRGVAIGN